MKDRGTIATFLVISVFQGIILIISYVFRTNLPFYG